MYYTLQKVAAIHKIKMIYYNTKVDNNDEYLKSTIDNVHSAVDSLNKCAD
jgi:hypothetical protein